MQTVISASGNSSKISRELDIGRYYIKVKAYNITYGTVNSYDIKITN
jgi:hypothetical protein